ncbi:MAG: hypothetical protein CVV49_14330 [Spirochaetae bacterium HGW-Spirochaetae-5]|nr:MAG: hypothetical protein CVV49_14330 [Spirochaetae bacterium HGW-Spirochaetae-5]
MKKNIIIISIILSFLIIAGCKKVIKTDPSDIDQVSNTLTDPAADNKNPILPGNNIQESGIKDITSHSGEFSITMSGYKGELFIGISNKRFYGTIKFFNWGNGVPQPLTDLKVTEDKIYFKRVIKTKEDLIKYGGTAYFEQDFYGIFTSDKKTIKGYYRYIGTQDNWEAVKK